MSPQLSAALPGLVLFGTLVGVCSGAMIYLLSARLSRRTILLPGLLFNCLVGALGFLGGVAAAMFISIPTHTQTHRVGDVIFRETTSRFQHPYWVGLGLSLAGPSIIEILRSRQARRRGETARVARVPDQTS